MITWIYGAISVSHWLPASRRIKGKISGWHRVGDYPVCAIWLQTSTGMFVLLVPLCLLTCGRRAAWNKVTEDTWCLPFYLMWHLKKSLCFLLCLRTFTLSKKGTCCNLTHYEVKHKYNRTQQTQHRTRKQTGHPCGLNFNSATRSHCFKHCLFMIKKLHVYYIYRFCV